MKPVIARLTVLTFLGIFSGISINAILLQDERAAYFDGRRDAREVVLQLENRIKLRRNTNVDQVASVKGSKSLDAKHLNAKIRDVLQSSGDRADNGLADTGLRSVVLAIQKRLILLGYRPGTPDGIAGPTTRASIMAFEFDKKIMQTGLADHEILAVLRGKKDEPSRGIKPEILARNSQELVAALQSALTKLGYNTGSADGLIGPMTRLRIRAFERDNKMEVTGRVSGRLVETIIRRRGRPLLLARL